MGSNCTVMYTFTPSIAGAETTTLMVTDNATGSPHSVMFTGTGTAPVIGASPNPLAFGNQPVGVMSTAKLLTLSNTGNAALMVTGGLAPTGTNAADFAQAAGGTCGGTPITIAAGGSCTLFYTFTPSVAMGETAMLQLANNSATTPFAVTLTGTGVFPTVTFTPNAATGVNFGAVQPGQTSGVMTVTLAVGTGTGNLQLSFIQAVSNADTNDFQIVTGTTCPTDGGTVAAGTSCVVNLTYTASFAGTETGYLQIVGTNLTGTPVNIPLTGVGASTAAGFMLTTSAANGGTVSILPGDTATFTIVVQPNPGFIGMISIQCVSGIPATIATASPATINVTTTPAPPTTVTCTLQTNCVPSLVAPRGPGNGPAGTPGPVGAVLLAALAAALAWRRKGGTGGLAGRLVPVAGMVVLVLLVMTWTACVSNPPAAIPGAPTTPAGTYQIQLVGTAAGGVRQVLPLTVRII